VGQISWRPNAEDLHAARALLQGIPKPWAKTRLAILMALSNHPEGTHRLIAREARTRTKVVTRFLEGWRASGVRALGQFGRPRELSATILSELRAAIESGSLCSLDEAADWLADKKRAGVRFLSGTGLRSAAPAQTAKGSDRPAAELPVDCGTECGITNLRVVIGAAGNRSLQSRHRAKVHSRSCA